ncbi:basic proline-rich protein-like [Eubalaena glacialis]|uniref:basic proline-rich protein-like n=1 Tax=Eubalaena glacialis TaxID=27606 RepID=UPI002A5AAF0B|nr:basic proline-rich protein-like [Eubalaena glacialis]
MFPATPTVPLHPERGVPGDSCQRADGAGDPAALQGRDGPPPAGRDRGCSPSPPAWLPAQGSPSRPPRSLRELGARPPGRPSPQAASEPQAAGSAPAARTHSRPGLPVRPPAKLLSPPAPRPSRASAPLVAPLPPHCPPPAAPLPAYLQASEKRANHARLRAAASSAPLCVRARIHTSVRAHAPVTPQSRPRGSAAERPYWRVHRIGELESASRYVPSPGRRVPFLHAALGTRSWKTGKRALLPADCVLGQDEERNSPHSGLRVVRVTVSPGNSGGLMA